MSGDFFALLGRLHLDPDLDLSGAYSLLLSSAVELCLRFRQYRQWPCSAWSLTKLYNPQGHANDCMQF